MKITTVFLADSANVREGTLNVLSGFVNRLHKSAFPAPLGVTLVAVAEFSAEEAGSPSASAEFSFACRLVSDEQQVFGGEGRVEGGTDDGMPGYLPMAFDISGLAVPAPGSYDLEFLLGNERASIQFQVVQAEGVPETGAR